MLPISSAQNPTIKLIRSLDDKKGRREAGLFVAEGLAMLERAEDLGWEPDFLAMAICPLSAGLDTDAGEAGLFVEFADYVEGHRDGLHGDVERILRRGPVAVVLVHQHQYLGRSRPAVLNALCR